MGCGSSSLKGDKVPDMTAGGAQEAPLAMRKVQTNFSDVDFTGEQNNTGRRKTEYLAPDESHRRPTRISEHGSEGRPSIEAPGTLSQGHADTLGLPTAAERSAELREQKQQLTDEGGATLQPYRTIEGETDGLASPTEKAYKDSALSADPTSQLSKHNFASENQPINETSKHLYSPPSSSSHLSPYARNSDGSAFKNELPPTDASPERKKSWFARAARVMDPGASRPSHNYTDEELLKSIGMTKAELMAWAANQPGVGKNQIASQGMPVVSPGLGSM